MTAREYKTGWQRMRRTRARGEHVCIQCCKRPAESGSPICEHCRLANAERATLRRSRAEPPPWCDECIASGFHRADCPTLRKRAA